VNCEYSLLVGRSLEHRKMPPAHNVARSVQVNWRPSIIANPSADAGELGRVGERNLAFGAARPFNDGSANEWRSPEKLERGCRLDALLLPIVRWRGQQ
jgi:hypothetical protein